MADLDDEAGTLLQQQSQLSEQFAELAASVEIGAERLNLDPEQMRQVEERYNLLQTLKRKYGGSLQEVTPRRKRPSAWPILKAATRPWPSSIASWGN